jgi:hypothetical protein
MLVGRILNLPSFSWHLSYRMDFIIKGAPQKTSTQGLGLPHFISFNTWKLSESFSLKPAGVEWLPYLAEGLGGEWDAEDTW